MDDENVPDGAVIVIAGNYTRGGLAGASLMGRFRPPVDGARNGDWKLEHDDCVRLSFVEADGTAQWVVRHSDGREYFCATIDAKIVATLDDSFIPAAPSPLAAWSVAIATLDADLKWGANPSPADAPLTAAVLGDVRAAWPIDAAIRARAVHFLDRGRKAKVVLASAAANATRAKAAKAEAAALAKIVAGGKTLAEAKAAMAATDGEAPKCAMPQAPAPVEGADADEDFDYATEWFPLPAKGASAICPLCAHCECYNVFFSLASMFGAAVEAASQIVLYWLVFRFVAVYLDTQGADAQWTKGVFVSIAMAGVGVASSVGVFLQQTLLPISLDNHMARIRLRFMKRALSQELAWCVASSLPPVAWCRAPPPFSPIRPTPLLSFPPSLQVRHDSCYGSLRRTLRGRRPVARRAQWNGDSSDRQHGRRLRSNVHPHVCHLMASRAPRDGDDTVSFFYEKIRKLLRILRILLTIGQ